MYSALEPWFLASGPRRTGDELDAGEDNGQVLTGRVVPRAALAD